MKLLTTISLKTPNWAMMTLNWRGHTVTVVVVLNDGHCRSCQGIFRRYAAEGERFYEWDAKLLLVWRESNVPEGCEGVVDESGVARRAWLDGDAAGVLLVDRDGTVVRQWSDSEKGFPDLNEVLAAAKHAALQCPE